jgi:translation initiation factor 1A
MYQTSIRNKKKISHFNKANNNNYNIDTEHEVYAYVIKLLGNCRVLVLCDNGTEAVGVIRGSMRRFNKRVLIETGDIIAVSIREYQDNKVDIVHKYNAEQCKILINNKELSYTLINAYNKVSICTINRADDDNIFFENMPGEVDDTKKENIDYNNSIFVFNSEDDEVDEAEEVDDVDDVGKAEEVGEDEEPAEADEADEAAEADDGNDSI